MQRRASGQNGRWGWVPGALRLRWGSTSLRDSGRSHPELQHQYKGSMETTPDTGNHIREFIKQTECLPAGVREKMRGKEREQERAWTRENGKARRIEKMSRIERNKGKRWRGSYREAVEFHQANRGPIMGKDTCKLTDEPRAS